MGMMEGTKPFPLVLTPCKRAGRMVNCRQQHKGHAWVGSTAPGQPNTSQRQTCRPTVFWGATHT